jgi:hypothetical protein
MRSMAFNLALYTVWAVFPLVLAVGALRPVSGRELSRFANRYGLVLNPESGLAVTKSVRRGRTGRLAGAALGLSLYPCLSAFGVGIPSESLLYGLVGYLVGAFVTSLVPSSIGTEVRRASLVPRRASDYLPRLALVTPGLALGISTAAVIALVVEPRRTVISFDGSPSGLVAAAIAAVATFAAIRVVVARPQPLSTPELVAVDDAIRTQALHTLAGSGIAVALFGTSATLWAMGGHAAFGWLHATGFVGGLCAIVAALYAWGFRSRPWRVQRTILS